MSAAPDWSLTDGEAPDWSISVGEVPDWLISVGEAPDWSSGVSARTFGCAALGEFVFAESGRGVEMDVTGNVVDDTGGVDSGREACGRATSAPSTPF